MLRGLLKILLTAGLRVQMTNNDILCLCESELPMNCYERCRLRAHDERQAQRDTVTSSCTCRAASCVYLFYLFGLMQ